MAFADMNYNQFLNEPDRLGNFIESDSEDEDIEGWYERMDKDEEEEDRKKAEDRNKAEEAVKRKDELVNMHKAGNEVMVKLKGTGNALDVDHNKLMAEYNTLSPEEKKGLMQKARWEMKWLYHDFQIHRERIKNNAGDDDPMLGRMIKELKKEEEEEEKEEERRRKKKKKKKKKKEEEEEEEEERRRKKEERNEKIMRITERRKKKKEEELDALYAEFPNEFRSLDISIFNIDDKFDKQLTDKTVLDWIKFKTEKKKKGGRKRTRRKKRRRKSTKKKRRRKRKRTKKKRKRRRR